MVLEETDIALPDILTELQDRTQLTRRSIQRILSASRRLDDFKRNPQQFIELAEQAINRCKRQALVHGIKYQRLGDEYYYAQELFEKEELTGYLKNMLDAEKSVYEQIVYDFGIEANFADQLEKNDAVKVYAKLPGWFTVKTPLGNYNPDWCSGSGPFGTLAFGTGMLFDPDKVLVGGLAIQRRVRAHVVVEELVLGELRGDVGDGEGAVVAAPELDAGGPVGPLDAAVELGPSRRQDVEGDAPVLAGLLEVGHELAAAVDLDGGDREGHDLGHGREEALGVAGGGLGEGPRVAMCRVVGQMARNSLMVWPSRLKVMWWTWTSSPGAWALAPYLHRSAQAPSKLRRRLGLSRPSQKDAGRTRPSAMALESIRPTVEADRASPSRASIAWSRALPM